MADDDDREDESACSIAARNGTAGESHIASASVCQPPENEQLGDSTSFSSPSKLLAFSIGSSTTRAAGVAAADDATLRLDFVSGRAVREETIRAIVGRNFEAMFRSSNRSERADDDESEGVCEKLT